MVSSLYFANCVKTALYYHFVLYFLKITFIKITESISVHIKCGPLQINFNL